MISARERDVPYSPEVGYIKGASAPGAGDIGFDVNVTLGSAGTRNSNEPVSGRKRTLFRTVSNGSLL